MAMSAESIERDNDAILAAYAEEKRTDPYLARQRRVWVMLGEAGKMRVSEGTLEDRVARLEQSS